MVVSRHLYALILTFSLQVLGAGALHAEPPQPPQMQLAGVLGSKALLMIDGERQLLAVGESSAQGIKLLSLQAEVAEVGYNNETYSLQLGGPVSSLYQQRESLSASVFANSNGMYITQGHINRFPVNLLLDTGATSVALNDATAKRIGLNYKLNGTPVTVETASGRVVAYRIMLDRVGVGEINLTQVEAVVIETDGPSVPLLGMSFLRRLNVTSDGSVMQLKTR